VYRYIKSNRIGDVYRDMGVLYYDETIETMIRQHFKGDTVSGDTVSDTVDTYRDTVSDTVDTVTADTVDTGDTYRDMMTDTLVGMLRIELDAKNKTIEDLTTANRDLTAANKDLASALVAAQQTANAAQILQGHLQGRLLTDGEVKDTSVMQEDKDVKDVGWFKRL
jgi:hypothetical protein